MAETEIGMDARHDVDRAFTELLQEMRVAQTGGQIFFAFLFSVAFTPAAHDFDAAQRTLYQWDIAVAVLSMAALVSPVAVHRAMFGRRARPWILRFAHLTTMLGLALLAVGLVLGVRLIVGTVSPDAPTPLTWWCAGGLVLFWLVLPLVIRWTLAGRAPDTANSPRQPSSNGAGSRRPTPRERGLLHERIDHV